MRRSPAMVLTVIEPGRPKDTGSRTLAVRVVDQPVLRLAARVTTIVIMYLTSWVGISLTINKATNRRLQKPTTTAR